MLAAPMAPERSTSELDVAIRSELHSRGFDAAIALLAGGQYGVVSRWQLLDIGLSPSGIDRRVAAGRLHPIHRGVYAVGHTRVCREGRWLAAVLACGEGAALSHRSAAALWGIRQYVGRPEVTTRHAHRRGRLLVARRSSIEPDEVTEHRGITVTSVPRTMIDLGAVLSPHQLDRAVREADYLRLFDLDATKALLERYPNRRGTAHLRKAIRVAAESDARTRSDLEDRFRALVLAADLPTPRFNETVELDTTTIEADAVWLDERVIVELDGYRAHGTRSRFESDRARDRAATLAGFVVIRFTDADNDGIAQLRGLLSARMPPRSGRPRSAVRRA